MSQGGNGVKSLGTLAAIAVAACALAAVAVCLASARTIDTGSGPKLEMQVCDNYISFLGSALGSDVLACHICCAKKHKSPKFLLKGTEINDEKCQCMVQGIRED